MTKCESSAWVTQCLLEEDLGKALVLGMSLRQVLTRASVVVIVDPLLPHEYRDKLESLFDYVHPINEEEFCKGWRENLVLAKAADSDLLAKVYSLGLTFYKSFIYLNSGSFVVKNCDELFEKKNNRIQNWISLDIINTVVPFYIEPSPKLFRALAKDLFNQQKQKLTKIKSICKGGNDKCDEKHSKGGNFACFGKPHFASVSLYGKDVDEDIADVCIVYLKDLPRNLDDMLNCGAFCNSGLLQKQIYSNYMKVYEEVSAHGLEGTDLNVKKHESKKYKNSIAVVGMSCRFPSANNLTEFWQLLISGGDAIRLPPEHRWSREQFPYKDPASERIEAGFLTQPVDEFDAKFFGMSPKEASLLDPQHRLLLEVVWESLENAGIDPSSLRGTSGGVFVGSLYNSFRDILLLQRNNPDLENLDFMRMHLCNTIGCAAARISHLLGFTGPCIGTESDCAASLLATHLACKNLRSGEANIALACGVNLLTSPYTTESMKSVLSPDQRCKTFDSEANGFVRAEGCAVLVLKRYPDAVKDEDHIWGIIRGTGMAQEGLSRSMGTPTVEGEALAMRRALEDADVHPSEISYVEAHGTGTVVGDPIEIQAIKKIYESHHQQRENDLIIGSVKTIVGHTESCSGMAGIIKTILSMKNEVIPPHTNLKELNPDLVNPLDSIPAKIPMRTVPWPKIKGKPRIAGISSFGIAGANGHLILEEPNPNYALDKKLILPDLKKRPLHMMKITAKSKNALDSFLEQSRVLLKPEGMLKTFEFEDIAYTINCGRACFPSHHHRAVLIAANSNEAYENLTSGQILRIDDTNTAAAAINNNNNICFLFPGQGCQYHGMAKQLYETSPVFRIHFDYCEDFLKSRYRVSITDTYFREEDEFGKKSIFSQTGILVIEYCLMKLWESWGVRPRFVLGHSLGEFCAAVCAGLLGIEDALTLVAERSLLIDANTPSGKMLVIQANKQEVDLLQGEFFNGNSNDWLDYAAFNTNEQTVVAGDSETIKNFKEFLKSEKKNVKCSLLQSSHAYHSRHMDPILEEYGKSAAKISYREQPSTSTTSAGAAIRFISGMTGQCENEVNADYWVRHTRDPVNFLNASKVVAVEEKCRTFLEIGPHPVLTAMIMLNANENLMPLCLPSLRRNADDWLTIFTSLGKLFVEGGMDLDWKGIDKFYGRSKTGMDILPTYPFQRSKHWPEFNKEIHPLMFGERVTVEAHSNKLLPDFYKIVWESSNSLNLNESHLELDRVLTAILKGEVDAEDQSDYSELEIQRREDIIKLISLYFLRTLEDLGWKPEHNKSFTLEQLISKLGIIKQHKNYVGRIMKFLKLNGFLLLDEERSNNDTIFVVKRLPLKTGQCTSEEIKFILQKHFLLDQSEFKTTAAAAAGNGCVASNLNEVPFLFIQQIGENLGEILTGKKSAIELLFPNDDDNNGKLLPASVFYNWLFAKTKRFVFPILLKQWEEMKAFYSKRSHPMPALRILEVGAGTGAFTEIFLNSMEQAGLPIQYYYTDISSAFFAKAGAKFERFEKSIKFRKLDIEKDPSSQGFPLKNFDFVIAAHVLHATRDVRESLINCRQLLKDGGILCLTESIPEDKNKNNNLLLINWIFGLLEGFWRLTDFELRDLDSLIAPMLPINKWEEILMETGFGEFSSIKFNYNNAFIMSRASKLDESGGASFSYEILSAKLNQKIKLEHRETAPIWLILYQEENETQIKLVKSLRKRLQAFGRKKVVLVKQQQTSASSDSDLLESAKLNYLMGDEIIIRPHSKTDMDKLFSLLFNSGKNRKSPVAVVEGIIVTWGVEACDGNESGSESGEQSLMAQSFLYLLQNLAALPRMLKLPQPLKCFLVTKNQYAIGCNDFCENLSASSLIGMARSFTNERNKDLVILRGIDIDDLEEEGANQIFDEVFGAGAAFDFNNELKPPFFRAYRNGTRFIPKLIKNCELNCEVNSSKNNSFVLNADLFWKEYYDKNEGNRKIEVCKFYIKRIISHVLRIKPEMLDDNGNLQEMGLDSLMSMELQNFLQCLCKSKNVNLSRAVVRDASSINMLGKNLMEFIEGAGAEANKT